MKTKTQKNNETTKQSSKIKKKNKLSKLARVFIVIGLVLAVAGVALGIYFLVRTPGKDPDDAPNLTPEQQQWVDAIVDSNNAPKDLTEQNFVLPSDVALSDVLLINDKYIVASKAGAEVIFIRDESNDLTGGLPVQVDSFDNAGHEESYDDVEAFYGDYVLVSNSLSRTKFVADLLDMSVVFDVTNFEDVEFKNGFVFASHDISASNNYIDLKVYHLSQGVFAFEADEGDKVSSYLLLEKSIKISGDNGDGVYSYALLDNKLELLSQTGAGVMEVEPGHNPQDGEVVILVDGQNYVVQTKEKVLLTTSEYQLVRKMVPTTDFVTANFKSTVGEDNPVDVYFVVSYYLKNLVSGAVSDFEIGSFLDYYVSDFAFDGYYQLHSENFHSFDEEGNELVYSQNSSTYLFDNSMNVILNYDYDKYGNVMYFTGKYFLTTGGHVSGFLSPTGMPVEIFDTKNFLISGKSVWNNHFIVRYSGLFGVSNTDAKVVVSPVWESLSPIINGYTIGYKDGHYYNINLNDGTAKVIENYHEEFHAYVMMGMGCFLTYNDSADTFSIHNEKGNVLYGNITDLLYTDIKSADDVLNLIVTVGNKNYLFSCQARDKVFAEAFIEDGYTPKEENNDVYFDSKIENLKTTSLENFHSEAWIRQQENSDQGGANNASSTGPVIDATNATSGNNQDGAIDAVPAGDDDGERGTDSLEDMITNVQTYHSRDNAWNAGWTGSGKDTKAWLSYNFGAIANETGSIQTRDDFSSLDSKFPLSPFVSKWDGGDYEGTTEFFNNYASLWSSGGIAYGYKQIDAVLDELGLQDQDRGYFVPTFDASSGKIADGYFETASENVYATTYWKETTSRYHDGTIFYRFGDNAIIAITRICVLKAGSTSGTTVTITGSGDLEKMRLGGMFTYYVGVALADGVTLDNMFLGSYAYKGNFKSSMDWNSESQLYDNYSRYEKEYPISDRGTFSTGWHNENDGYGSVVRGYRKVACFGKYNNLTSGMSWSAVERGLVVRAGLDSGFLKTLGNETQQGIAKYLTYGTLSSNTGKTFYCRGFYPSSYLLSGTQSRNGSNNSYTLDFSLAYYAEKIVSSSYGSSYSCSYGAETTAMMYLSLGWFYSQSESVSIRHESEFKLKSDTNFTAYSNYFKVNFSGSDNGTIKVTAAPGFLITKISYAYFKTENWWEDNMWGGDWHTDRSWAPYTTEYTLKNQNDGDHNSIIGIKNFVVSVMPISYYIKIHKISQGTKAQTATAVSGETDEIEIRKVVHGGAVVDAQYADWNPFFVVNSQSNDNQQFGGYSAFYQTMVNGLSSGTKILTPETLYERVWNESLVGNYNMELGDFVGHANKNYINFVAFEARFVADPNGGSDYKPVNIKTKPREGGMERAATVPPLLEDETFAVYEGDNGYDYISSVVTYNNANISTWAIDENEYLPGTQTENPNFGKWTWNSLKHYSTLDDGTEVFIQYRPVAIGHTAEQIIFKNDFVRNDDTTDLVDSAKDYFESLSGPGGGVINLYLPMTPKTYTFNILYRDGFVDKVGDNNSPHDETEVNNLQAESVKIKLDRAALEAIESFRAFALEHEEQCEVFEYPEASGNFFFRYQTTAVSGINVLKKGISFPVEFKPNDTSNLHTNMREYYKKIAGDENNKEAAVKNELAYLIYFALSETSALPELVTNGYLQDKLVIKTYQSISSDTPTYQVWNAASTTMSENTANNNDMGVAGKANHVVAMYLDKTYAFEFNSNLDGSFRIAKDGSGNIQGTTKNLTAEQIQNNGYTLSDEIDYNFVYKVSGSNLSEVGALFHEIKNANIHQLPAKYNHPLLTGVDDPSTDFVEPGGNGVYTAGAPIAAKVDENDAIVAIFMFEGWYTMAGNLFDWLSNGGMPIDNKISDLDEDDGKLDGKIELFALFKAVPVEFEYKIVLERPVGGNNDEYPFYVGNKFAIDGCASVESGFDPSVSNGNVVSGKYVKEVLGTVHGGETGTARAINIDLTLDQYFVSEINFAFNRYTNGWVQIVDKYVASLWDSFNQTGGEFAVDQSGNIVVGAGGVNNENLETQIKATRVFDGVNDRFNANYEIDLTNCGVGKISYAMTSVNGEGVSVLTNPSKYGTNFAHGWVFDGGVITIKFADKGVSAGAGNDGEGAAVAASHQESFEAVSGNQDQEVIAVSATVTASRDSGFVAEPATSFEDDEWVEIVKKENQNDGFEYSEDDVLESFDVNSSNNWVHNLHQDDILDFVAKSTGYKVLYPNNPNLSSNGFWRVMTSYVSEIKYFAQLGTDTIQGTAGNSFVVTIKNANGQTRSFTLVTGMEYAFGIEFEIKFEYDGDESGNYFLSITSIVATLKFYVLHENELYEILMPSGGWLVKTKYSGTEGLQVDWKRNEEFLNLEFSADVSASKSSYVIGEVLANNNVNHASRYRLAIFTRGANTTDTGAGIPGDKMLGFSTRDEDASAFVAEDIFYKLNVFHMGEQNASILPGSEHLLETGRYTSQDNAVNEDIRYRTANLFVYEPKAVHYFGTDSSVGGTRINDIDGFGVMIHTRAKTNYYFEAKFDKVQHQEILLARIENVTPDTKSKIGFAGSEGALSTQNVLALKSVNPNGYDNIIETGQNTAEYKLFSNNRTFATAPTYFYVRPNDGQYIKDITISFEGTTVEIVRNGDLGIDASGQSVFFAEGLGESHGGIVGGGNKVLGVSYRTIGNTMQGSVVDKDDGSFYFAVFGAWHDFSIKINFSAVRFVHVAVSEETVKSYVNAIGKNYDTDVKGKADLDSFFVNASVTQNGKVIASDFLSKVLDVYLVKSGESDTIFALNENNLSTYASQRGEGSSVTYYFVIKINKSSDLLRLVMNDSNEAFYSNYVQSLTEDGTSSTDLFVKQNTAEFSSLDVEFKVSKISGNTITDGLVKIAEQSYNPQTDGAIKEIFYAPVEHSKIVLSVRNERNLVMESWFGVGGSNYREEWRTDEEFFNEDNNPTAIAFNRSVVFGKNENREVLYMRKADVASPDAQAVFFGSKLFVTVSQKEGYHSPWIKVSYVSDDGSIDKVILQTDFDQNKVVYGTPFEINLAELGKNQGVLDIMRVNVRIDVYQKAQETQITYDANGGQFGSSTPKVTEIVGTTNKVFGVKSNLQETAFTSISKDGYVFVGYAFDRASYNAPASNKWAVSENSTLWTESNAVFKKSDKNGFDSDQAMSNIEPDTIANNLGEVRLYAVWKAKSFVLEYNTNKGVGSTDPVLDIIESTQIIDGGTLYFDHSYGYVDGTVANDKVLGVPERQGYVFKGWALTRAIASEDELLCAESLVASSANDGEKITLFAIWEAIEYTIDFDLGQGTGSSVPTLPENYEYTIRFDNEFLTKIADPVRNGYNFVGWFTDRVAGQKIVSGGTSGNVTKVDKDFALANASVVDDEQKKIVLFARWESINNFNLYFVLDNSDLFGFGKTGVTFDLTNAGSHVNVNNGISAVSIPVAFDGAEVDLMNADSSVYDFVGWLFESKDRGTNGSGFASTNLKFKLDASNFDKLMARNVDGTFRPFAEAFAESNQVRDIYLFAAFDAHEFDVNFTEGNFGEISPAVSGFEYSGSNTFVETIVPQQGYKLKTFALKFVPKGATEAQEFVVDLEWDSNQKLVKFRIGGTGTFDSTQVAIENEYFESMRITSENYGSGRSKVIFTIENPKAGIDLNVQFDEQTYKITVYNLQANENTDYTNAANLSDARSVKGEYLVKYGEYFNKGTTSNAVGSDAFKNATFEELDGTSRQTWKPSTFARFVFLGYYKTFTSYSIKDDEISINSEITVNSDAVELENQQIFDNQVYYMVYSRASEIGITFYVWDINADDGNGGKGKYVVLDMGDKYLVGDGFTGEYLDINTILVLPSPNAEYWPAETIFNGYVVADANRDKTKFITNDILMIESVTSAHAGKMAEIDWTASYLNVGSELVKKIAVYAVYDRQVFDVKDAFVDTHGDEGDIDLGAGKFMTVSHRLAWIRNNGSVVNASEISTILLDSAQYAVYLQKIADGATRESALEIAKNPALKGASTTEQYLMSYIKDETGAFVYYVATTIIVLDGNGQYRAISSVDGSNVELSVRFEREFFVTGVVVDAENAEGDLDLEDGRFVKVSHHLAWIGNDGNIVSESEAGIVVLDDSQFAFYLNWMQRSEFETSVRALTNAMSDDNKGASTTKKYLFSVVWDKSNNSIVSVASTVIVVGEYRDISAISAETGLAVEFEIEINLPDPVEPPDDGGDTPENPENGEDQTDGDEV